MQAQNQWSIFAETHPMVPINDTSSPAPVQRPLDRTLYSRSPENSLFQFKYLVTFAYIYLWSAPRWRMPAWARISTYCKAALSDCKTTLSWKRLSRFISLTLKNGVSQSSSWSIHIGKCYRHPKAIRNLQNSLAVHIQNTWKWNNNFIGIAELISKFISRAFHHILTISETSCYCEWGYRRAYDGDDFGWSSHQLHPFWAS